MHQYHAAKIISSSVENDYTEKHINERIIVQFIITLLLVILLVPDISKAHHPSVVKCIF